MLPIDLFRKVIIFLSYAYQGQNTSNTANPPDAGEEWSYDDIPAWGNISPICNTGKSQSPIALSIGSSLFAPIRRLEFINYDVPLTDDLILFNNGHTVEMEIPVTINGGAPTVTGGPLKDLYVAQNVHFHWGAPGIPGAEHTINNKRYDVEMHIVHRNSKYVNIEEAVQHGDGITVLGIMLKIVDDPDRIYPGLNKLFNTVPNVTQYDSESPVNGPLTTGQLLGDVNTKQFYTYQGSLTTPPCAEAVTWIVFPTPLPFAYEEISKLFEVRDQYGDYLLENYRPLQARNRRKVLYRLSPFDPIFSPFTPF